MIIGITVGEFYVILTDSKSSLLLVATGGDACFIGLLAIKLNWHLQVILLRVTALVR